MYGLEGKLSTSRFSAHELIIRSGLAPVRISVGHPRFKLRYELAGSLRSLMPTRPMLKLERAEYEAAYRAILDASGPEKIAAELAALLPAGAPGLVLLCFEDLAKPGEWCHRRMFADWWRERTGGQVPELAPEPAREVQGLHS